MNEDTRKYLEDLLVHLNDVTRFTTGGQQDFRADRKTQFAVIRAYEVIGEIIKRLPGDLLDTQPHVDWRRVVRFRDFLAHNYEKVDLDYIWSAVDDLPALRGAVESLLSGLDELENNEDE